MTVVWITGSSGRIKGFSMESKKKLIFAVALAIFIIAVLVINVVIKNYEKGPLALPQDIKKAAPTIKEAPVIIPGENTPLKEGKDALAEPTEENEPYIGEGPLVN